MLHRQAALCFLLVGTIFIVPVPPLSHSPTPTSRVESNDRASHASLDQIYGKLPLSFEENRGQVDEKVKFLSRGSGYTLFLTPTEAVLALSSKPEDKRTVRASATAGKPLPQRSAVLRMKLIDANRSPLVTGVDELPGKSNYLIGSDPANWRTNVPTFSKVKFGAVYPGIDLVYYGNQRQLEYDWIVAPGAKPETIKFAIEGAKRIKVDPNGDLVLAIAGGEVRLQKPVVYQETDGVRREIASGYVPKTNQEVGFEIAGYDPTEPLVIDPVLLYSTYLGGSGVDYGRDIVVDSSGNAYVVGYTESTNFPTVNPLQPAVGGGSTDAFVTKFNPSGTALVYSTYLGGSGVENGNGITLDSLGNVYVTGATNSNNFPTVNPLQPLNGGDYDGFLTKLNPSGSTLIYSTYLGGSGQEFAYDVDVDPAGNAYVTGYTASNNFPTANPFQPASNGGDAFVTKFNASGSALIYSTYLGGPGTEFWGVDIGRSIAVDSSGSAYVTGMASSTSFPTVSARQPTGGGFFKDAFVTKFNPSGSVVFSTYHGGLYEDDGESIAVDSSGNIYVAGSTSSDNFPTANPLQPARKGDDFLIDDAFVTKFNPSGSALVYSTYLGGSSTDMAFGVALDSMGSAYITGWTRSPDFPTIRPIQAAQADGFDDVFVAKLSTSGGALVYSTYLGGNGHDTGEAIAVDSSGSAYITGHTVSPTFPTANPLQPTLNGTRDAFVAKISDPPTSFEITLSKSVYTTGDTITATEFRVRNSGPSPVPVHLGIWLVVPTVGDVVLVELGADGSFSLPGNLDLNLGPVSLLTVTETFPPRGNWQWNSFIKDPATGAVLHVDVNPFVVQ